MANDNLSAAVKLQRAVDPARDHVRDNPDPDSAALAGVVLAAFLPTRPAPAAAPLLAQAATALAELEHAEREAKAAGTAQPRIEEEPIWD